MFSANAPRQDWAHRCRLRLFAWAAYGFFLKSHAGIPMRKTGSFFAAYE
jgi:hypothetical protein